MKHIIRNSASPMKAPAGPILPMHWEDERFFKLRRERKQQVQQESNDGLR